MRSQPFVAAVPCALCLLALVPVARGADDDFSLSVTPYAWFTGVTGDIGVAGFKTDIDQNICDLYNDTDDLLGLFGRAEGRFRRFGLYVDGGYMRIGVDDVSGPLGLASVDVTQQIGVIDFGLMYRLTDWQQGEFRTAIDGVLGLRYWWMDLELDPANFSAVSGDQSWIDPIVGLRSITPLGRDGEIVLGGDIGGFGAASDFTWSAIATIGYKIHLGRVESSIFAGYKAIGDDYADDGFTWDTTLHGPIVGWRFLF